MYQLLLILCIPAAILANTAFRTHVYVYDGFGTNELHVMRIVRHLQDNLASRYVVSTISADAIRQGDWATDAALFVMPGGFDLGFVAALGNEGASIIRHYVNRGGAYLGLGAGSYYACDRIEFDLGGRDEVTGDRPLKFFPGMCSGPVYAPYSYITSAGVRAAPINFRFLSPDTNVEESAISMRAYFNGGNTFHVDSSIEQSTANTQCVTIASFSEINNTPAIVKCNRFNGVAVLAGVHLEFGSMHTANTYGMLLHRHEITRGRAFHSILHHLRLDTRYPAVLPQIQL